MSISIKWLLDSCANQEIKFELLAGDTSMDIPITGVNIMDNPDTIPWLLKGTLVLSTGYLFLNEAFTQNIIQEMYDKGCSGLGIKMNRYIDKLPAIMVEQAEKLHFPIISVPFSSSMNQITAMVYRKMFDDEISEAMRLNLIYKDLSECVLKKQSIKHMLPIIGNALNCSVFLTNDSFEIIEYSMLQNSLYSFPFSFCKDNYSLFSETDTIYLKNRYSESPLPYISHKISNSQFETFEFELFPIVSRAQLLGFLVLLKENETLTEVYDFIQSIQTILCIAMMNISVLTESERSNRDIFFKNVLSGSYNDIQEIELMCRQNNFDFGKNRICICIKSQEYEQLTIAQRRAMERKIFNLIHSVSDDETVNILHAVFQTYFIFFLFPTSETNLYQFSQFCILQASNWLKTLNSIDSTMKAGISSVFHGSDTIITSYKQAKQALDIGFKLHKDTTLFSYAEDLIYHELMNHFTRQDLQQLYNSSLGILEKYDLKNHSQLLDTLEAYLHCEQNITKTAKQLYIHRNTMFYRLDQIKDLLHLELNDSDALYRIQTGFYIRKILD